MPPFPRGYRAYARSRRKKGDLGMDRLYKVTRRAATVIAHPDAASVFSGYRSVKAEMQRVAADNAGLLFPSGAPGADQSKMNLTFGKKS